MLGLKRTGLNAAFIRGGPRYFHGTGLKHQYEALGVLVDAADKAKEEIEEKAAEHTKKLKRLRRAVRPPPNPGPPGARNGPNNGGTGSNGGSGVPPRGNGANEGVWRKRVRGTFIKAAETALIMTAGLAMLGCAGLVYHRLYRSHALNKMETALDEWDLVLQMSSGHKKLGDDVGWVERPQQTLVSNIVAGKVSGRYWVLLGEKGSGKTSMLLHAIEQVGGENVVVMDAHPDPEIFRQRLGKALHFEFHEDYWGGLFSLRGPRENTFLDIERVFNVLEEVAVRRFRRLKRPLCLVINGAHLIPENEDGNKVLTLLQQKAEAFSGSGIANVVFNSDDYWLYQRLARVQTRMDAISASDLTKPEAVQVLRRLRQRVAGEEVSDKLCETIYWLVGGRPQHLAAVAGQPDMVAASQQLIDREKQWFLNCCGLLGAEMDDDVMDSGKFSTSAMLLAREFVRAERQQAEQHAMATTNDTTNATTNATGTASGTQTQTPTDSDILVGGVIDADGTQMLPRIPLWRARQIMTRPDFIREYDNLNLFTLDALSRVKPDSVVMMHAFREIVELPGFDDLLDATLDRVADIESLGRTREVTLKDLGGGGGRVRGSYILRGNRLELELPGDVEEDDDNDEQLMLDSSERYFWKRRMQDIREKARPRNK